jgi:uncharacterized protein
MTEFTPYASLGGGLLIGLSAVILMLFNGKIAGATGILGGILPPFASDWGWRLAFILGAIMAPVLLVASGKVAIDVQVPVSNAGLVFGGLLVGIGVVYGSGCTSGHGICGLARLSPRSFVATLVFMLFTGLTVYIVRHVIGGL